MAFKPLVEYLSTMTPKMMVPRHWRNPLLPQLRLPPPLLLVPVVPQQQQQLLLRLPRRLPPQSLPPQLLSRKRTTGVVLRPSRHRPRNSRLPRRQRQFKLLRQRLMLD